LILINHFSDETITNNSKTKTKQKHFFREPSDCNISVSLLKALTPLLQKITDELYQQMRAKKYINYDTALVFLKRYQKQNNKKIFVEMAVHIGLSKSKVRNLGDKVVPSIYSQLYEKCFQIYAITLKLI
jgi:hypothetical protein